MHDVEELAVPAADLVGRVQAAARVGENAEDDPRRDLQLLLVDDPQELREGVAVDELHREVEHLVLFPEVEHLRDVVVLDAGGEPGLVEEHALEARVLRVLGKDRLDGDELLEAALAAQTRDPHARHAPLGDRAEHLVAVELVARRDG